MNFVFGIFGLVEYKYAVYIIYVAQTAQIFIRFALQHNVSEIGPNFLFRETNFVFGIFGHIGGMSSVSVYIAQMA